MRGYLPVFALLLLSPYVAEVLFGATPLRNIGALLVVIPLYGGGAVLVRELARRRGPEWGRILLLGAAYGIIEEGLIIQSMFDPKMFDAGLVGARALGVNWVWTMWTIGYHIVWSISIPILLAELLLQDRRTEPWLGRVGLVVIGVLYALGALALTAIYRFAVAPDFKLPVLHNILAALIAIVLIVFALRRSSPLFTQPVPTTEGNAPSPWVVALLGLVMAGLWFGLLDLPHSLRTGALALVPIVLGIALVVGFVSLLRRWSADRNWSELHRLALVPGPLIVSASWGLWRVTAGSPVDQGAVVVFAVIAVIFLLLLARRLQKGRGAVAIAD